MNPVDAFRKYRDNPGNNDHGDLWAAYTALDKRIAIADERQRMALWIVVPLLGFLVAVQLMCLGVLLR